jgi:hypothetical protein
MIEAPAPTTSATAYASELACGIARLTLDPLHTHDER